MFCISEIKVSDESNEALTVLYRIRNYVCSQTGHTREPDPTQGEKEFSACTNVDEEWRT